jgi:hypothetical protein
VAEWEVGPLRAEGEGVIRLFVGVDGNNCDLESQAVLEYSVRKYASEDVAITWMQQAKTGPYSGWNMKSARTPFTHYRWSLPAMCGYQGKAIYTDSDFIFMADIAELWHQPVPSVLLLKEATGKLNTAAMVVDCAKAKGHIPDLDALRKMVDANDTMAHYFRDHRHLVAPFEGAWNCIDLKGYKDINDPRIKAAHYSRIEHQVQLRHAIPRLKSEGRKHWYSGPVFGHPRPELQELFDTLLVEATAAGYGIERYRVKGTGESTRRAFAYKAHKGVAL